MQSLEFIQLATFAMVFSVVLLVLLTIGVKGLRYLRESFYRANYRRIEPALERYVLTGEAGPELTGLAVWRRDLFLSTLIVERMAVLRGAGREYLEKLADELGLVDRFRRGLKSRRRWRRARAAEYLGFFGGERVVGDLYELLRDEDETVRSVAARALARIGSDVAVRTLVDALDFPSELTRLRVAENLERVGAKSAGPLADSLADAVSFGTKSVEGPVMAARVLGNLRAAEARPVLRRAALEGKVEDVRAQAVLALGRVGDPEDVPVVLKAAEDESWPVRAQAANALGLIGDPDTVYALRWLAADEAWWVRLNACKALANMGPSGEAALVDVLLGGDRYARDRAAAVLESRGVTRRAVRNLAAQGRKGERARRIVEAVVKAGATRHLQGLLNAMPEGGEERRLLSGMLESVPSDAVAAGPGAGLEAGAEGA